MKDFIDHNSPPFVMEATDIGEMEREKRLSGRKLKKNAGELAMVDFLSSEEGIGRYLTANEPVAILFEDAGLRVFNRPPNLHLISTVGLLRGLEEVGVISSADEVIREMLHPSKHGRRPGDARKFTDLPDGVDEAAAIGRSWKP